MHLMSSKGAVWAVITASVAWLCIVLCILFLMIYNFGGEDEFRNFIFFFTDFCPEVMLVHAFNCLLVHARIQISAF